MHVHIHENIVPTCDTTFTAHACFIIHDTFLDAKHSFLLALLNGMATRACSMHAAALPPQLDERGQRVYEYDVLMVGHFLPWKRCVDIT
jgi:hypothetical protein